MAADRGVTPGEPTKPDGRRLLLEIPLGSSGVVGARIDGGFALDNERCAAASFDPNAQVEVESQRNGPKRPNWAVAARYSGSWWFENRPDDERGRRCNPASSEIDLGSTGVDDAGTGRAPTAEPPPWGRARS
jgi:hypothetical protein